MNVVEHINLIQVLKRLKVGNAINVKKENQMYRSTRTVLNRKVTELEAALQTCKRDSFIAITVALVLGYILGKLA